MVFHFPPISGGGVVVIVEIANKLAELGHEVTIICPKVKWNGEKYNPTLNKNIDVIWVDVPSSENLKIAARRCKNNLLREGIKIGNKKKMDFVLSIFHPFHLVPSAAVSCAKELSIPSLIKIDDAVYEKAKGLKSIQRKIEKIYHTKTLKNANRVLVSNSSTGKLINEFYKIPNEKIAVVPNGVELDIFYSNKATTKNIIFSGVMYYHRGVDILLDAIPIIIKENPDVKLILLGAGPELGKLKEIVKNKEITKNVIFEGWVDRNMIPQYLSEAAIAIGPLRSTTVTKNALPIKVLEYMASSLPIIASNNTLPEDVLKNGTNGFYVNNSSEIASRINQLLRDQDLCEEMGKKSQEMAQKFSWEKVVNRIIEEYDKSIKNDFQK